MNKLRLFALFFGLIIFGYASAFWGAGASANPSFNTSSGSFFEQAANFGQPYFDNPQLIVFAKANNIIGWVLATNSYEGFVKKLAPNDSIPSVTWYNTMKGKLYAQGVVLCNANDNDSGVLLCMSADQKTTTNLFKTNSQDLQRIIAQFNAIPISYGN